MGLLLAFTLPYYFLNFSVYEQYISQSLQEGNFNSAILLIGNYYNDEPVVQCTFASGGGLVLFEAVMQVPQDTSESDGKEDAATELQQYMLYKSYIGFLYGVADTYKTFGVDDNKTQLEIDRVGGGTSYVKLLDYDSNKDNSLDGIAMMDQNNFVILDLDESSVRSIDRLKFVDKDGNIFQEDAQELQNLNFTYSSEFFDSFDEFMPQYNDLVRQMNSETGSTATTKNKLGKLFEDFNAELTKNTHFKVVTTESKDYKQVYSELEKIADKKGVPYVIVYFVGIYIIGDFLLGNRYIIKFFRWFLYKVCKIKPRTRQKLSKNEVFGHDYYSSVTMSLDLEAVPDFNESVQIKYTNTDVEIVFILLKENNYTATERIKAGVYVNPFIDMDRRYAPTDLPDNLVVEGYKMDVKVKILRRED